MKFGAVNKSTTVNRFVLHTLQRNITHLALITRKTNIKPGILKRWELEKSQELQACVGLKRLFQFYGLTSGLTRLIMKTKNVFHGLINLPL